MQVLNTKEAKAFSWKKETPTKSKWKDITHPRKHVISLGKYSIPPCFKENSHVHSCIHAPIFMLSFQKPFLALGSELTLRGGLVVGTDRLIMAVVTLS